jgi:hypothetical protein
MLYTASGSLPKHQYVYVLGEFVGLEGVVPAVWFGLHSHPARAWGCTVMLESGAVFRNLPPHALTWQEDPEAWDLSYAQMWNCYGPQFSVHEYTYLTGLRAAARVKELEFPCSYLFTVIPVNDGFTAEPTQDKEFMFLRTDFGRLTIQPTNRVKFIDASFTKNMGWPSLAVQRDIYSCED